MIVNLNIYIYNVNLKKTYSTASFATDSSVVQKVSDQKSTPLQKRLQIIKR